MKRVLALFAFVVGIALFGQRGYLFLVVDSVPDETLIFKDVSRLAGIVDNRVASLDMAVGEAWGDYDNDGWVDLYVTDPDGPNTLYHNNGDGTFSVSPLADQVALFDAYSEGATFADFDNDGWRDLMVVNWGVNNLFHNEGGQRFVDVARQAGLLDNKNSKSASWGDFDSDGFVDLYVANWSCYPECGRSMDGDSDRLYRNNGDGTFEDVSDYLGGSLNGAGFIASFVDYDNDGDPDIYLVNDEFINPVGNKLWRNDGPGCNGWCFTQVAEAAGANSKLFGMGLAVGDYDNDGNVDFYFSNVGPMELLKNRGDGTFTEVAAEAGVQTPADIGWGALFFDYNNDGWRDLYLAVPDTANHRDIAANKLFHNNADGTFTLVSCDDEAADVRPSLSAAYADYDHDGWLDLVVGNMDVGYRLYRNQGGASGLSQDNHWLALALVGSGPVNRDAVGTRVYLTTPDGLTQMQDVINGFGLGGGSDLTLYFGLDEAETADLNIRWPDGRTQTFNDVAADQRYHLAYPQQGETALKALPHPRLSLESPPNQQGRSVVEPIILSLIGLLSAGIGVLVLSMPLEGKKWESALLGGLIFVGIWAITATAMGVPMGRVWSVDGRLHYLMEQANVQPPTNPDLPSTELVKLGEALFWDPELSGNRDTACVTCHHPLTATGDNLSLPIGTGGVGLGELRVKPDDRREFVPRNAQPLFNLGYTEWTTFFWDGRVSGDAHHGFNTPASDRLPDGLDSLLAAQALFPITSRDEMRGLRGDEDIFGQVNELAKITDYTSQPIWQSIMQRLLAIPGYVTLFQQAYPDVPVESLGIEHVANAIAAYEATTFTFEDSPFDRYIRGDRSALSAQEKQGALLFYGKAGCSSCHSGGLLTDQQFYNLAVPQIGPGKGREQPYDLGRARETGSDCDRYAFRTPPLRNVAITGPWMHNGAFTSLEEVVRHHLNPAASLEDYNPEQLAVALRDTCQDQPETLAAVLATESDSASEQVMLSAQEMQDLLAFLNALTSPSALNLADTIPASVPSGLSVGGNLSGGPTPNRAN
ncbi:MAG: VCBS repeat-containing protein [Ardenticatenaceae bacterium]|nr:VCBS repeat-containing protein [Ardenticatenaceae bacterium]MCB9446518.1 VCBS repeat-containing protein [Ardenticatenaceae bacterium]